MYFTKTINVLKMLNLYKINRIFARVFLNHIII